jgi:AraC family transcriptional regulator
LLNFARSKNIACDDTHLIGIIHDDDRITDEDKLRFDACVIAPEYVMPTGDFGVQTIKGGRYVVFKHQGSHKTLHDTYRQIYAHWYPNSGMVLRDLPCFSKRVNSSVLPERPDELPLPWLEDTQFSLFPFRR